MVLDFLLPLLRTSYNSFICDSVANNLILCIKDRKEADFWANGFPFLRLLTYNVWRIVPLHIASLSKDDTATASRTLTAKRALRLD